MVLLRCCRNDKVRFGWEKRRLRVGLERVGVWWLVECFGVLRFAQDDGKNKCNSYGRSQMQRQWQMQRQRRRMGSESVAADADLHAGADGEGQAGVADGADVWLVEEIVELGEEGDAAGGGEDGVEVELGVG